MFFELRDFILELRQAYADLLEAAARLSRQLEIMLRRLLRRGDAGRWDFDEGLRLVVEIGHLESTGGFHGLMQIGQQQLAVALMQFAVRKLVGGAREGVEEGAPLPETGPKM